MAVVHHTVGKDGRLFLFCVCGYGMASRKAHGAILVSAVYYDLTAWPEEALRTVAGLGWSLPHAELASLRYSTAGLYEHFMLQSSWNFCPR